MSTEVITETDREASTTRRPVTWHAPADTEQMDAARSGRPWVARCGLRVKRTRPGIASRKAWQLAPMEPCVVCVGLGAR